MTRSSLATLALLAAAAVLLTTWSLVVPVFEAPDEPAHWQYARYLHDHWGRGDLSLPYYAPGFDEANSPPLAYAAIAPLAVASPLPSMAMAADVHGSPVTLWPPRLFYDTDRDLAEYGPIRRARLVMVAMGVVTVWLCGLVGRAATGRAETGWLTALIVLLLPQAAFRNATISNDALLLTGSAAVTLGLVRIMRTGYDWRRGAWTAAALAAAFLSKINAIALLVPAAFALVCEPGLPTRRRLTRVSVLAVTVALVLPWSLRNVVLYGDPFASGAMHDAVAHIINQRSIVSSYFLWDFPRLLAMSFVGVFGWANVYLPTPMYAAYGAGALIAFAGLVRGWMRGALDRRLTIALALAILAALAVVVRINLSFTQPQGRYLFPALPAIALLLALGFEEIMARWPTRVVLAVVVGALALGNLYALFGVVRPAYQPTVAHEIAPGVRRLGLSATADVRWDLAAREFIVSGPAPWWQVPIDEPADAVSSVTIVVRAAIEPVSRRGCLLFATDRANLAGNPATCFAWRADGTSQRIAVTMRGRPGWTGRLTHLRVTLFDDGPPPDGARVRFEDWLTQK